jgi:hypothetical protein
LFARGTVEQHTSRKENKLPKIVYVALVRGDKNAALVCPDELVCLVCIFVLMAVPWLKRLVAGLSSRRPAFVPGSVHVAFAGTKWHWDRFISEFFGFPLSISFHHCSILIWHRPMRCTIALNK